MTRQAVLFCLMALLPGFSGAQTFTEYLTRARAGEGSVVLHQDAEIAALVNGSVPPVAAPASPRAVAPRSQETSQKDSLSASSHEPSLQQPVLGRRMKANGYRIQVYAGGNNRQSKTEAYRLAEIVRTTFDEVAVYTKFISPRWTCRVGDFRTYEEATEMLKRIRETQKFREASIVKSPIIVIY